MMSADSEWEMGDLTPDFATPDFAHNCSLICDVTRNMGSGLPFPIPDFLLIFIFILLHNPAHGWT